MGSQSWRSDRVPEYKPLGFWSVDVSTLRSKLDPSMSGLFGVDAAEGAAGLEQDRLVPRIHPDDRARASRCLDEAIKTRGPYSYRYRLKTENGGFRWVQATGRAFMDEAGRVTHLSGILTDIMHPPVPADIAVIDKLLEAHKFAQLTSDPMLGCLIEAVLLHAGRAIAKNMDPFALD